MELTRENKIGAIVLLVFFGVIMYITMKAYLGMFFLALIIVIAMFPFYDWVLGKVKNKAWASIIASFTFLFIVVVPLGLFFIYATNEAVQYFSTVEITPEEKNQIIVYIEDNFPGFADALKTIEVSATDAASKFVEVIGGPFA